MKIVVLDGYILNPGDLAWEGLEKLAQLEVYDRTESHLIVERAAEAQLVLTNKTSLNAETLRQLPRLRYIGVLATGYNIVDIEAAKDLGIVVSNVPTYGTASVAQFTIALLLELCHHVGLHSEAVRAGDWAQSKDWCFWRTPLLELDGKVLGVVGLGRIGRQVGKIGTALGMRVIYSHSGQSPDLTDDRFERRTLEQLLALSDVVSLHCPLFPETQGLIHARRLELMKPSAFLINTSRGSLVVDLELADALNGGRLAGAALDVLAIEPPLASNPLLRAKNCLVTPHIAWATREARRRLMETAVHNAAAFIRGTPVNVVNPNAQG